MHPAASRYVSRLIDYLPVLTTLKSKHTLHSPWPHFHRQHHSPHCMLHGCPLGSPGQSRTQRTISQPRPWMQLRSPPKLRTHEWQAPGTQSAGAQERRRDRKQSDRLTRCNDQQYCPPMPLNTKGNSKRKCLMMLSNFGLLVAPFPNTVL